MTELVLHKYFNKSQPQILHHTTLTTPSIEIDDRGRSVNQASDHDVNRSREMILCKSKAECYQELFVFFLLKIKLLLNSTYSIVEGDTVYSGQEG